MKLIINISEIFEFFVYNNYEQKLLVGYEIYEN